MGKSFSFDDVVLALSKFDMEYRATFPEGHWVTYAISYMDKVYPPKKIMRLVTGLENVGSGGKPVNSRFEELGFSITLLDETKDMRTLPPEEQSEYEGTVSLESDLENALVIDLSQIESDLKLFSSNGISGEQYDTKLVGIIDILAIDKNGDYVVIELKANEVDRQVCGQIQAYMAWVKDKLAGSKSVRGIVIAKDFTIRAIYAASIVPHLSLKKYRMKFEISDVQKD
jgi:hypothetical protein